MSITVFAHKMCISLHHVHHNLFSHKIYIPLHSISICTRNLDTYAPKAPQSLHTKSRYLCTMGNTAFAQKIYLLLRYKYTAFANKI